ncbi:MAG: aminotransferase class I/II-fold pyridoxal phosphate-dependent enzyme, partial [Chloroflexi bacterium]|nr:aminotransferase class I/II-fold pyridoxal phosphate-dependent enzyme [Chloroflexota bacterium]
NCPPTFGMYAFSTGVCAGKLVTVRRGNDFALDLPAIRRAVTPRTKVIFVASPNNPSGNVTPEKAIRELLDLGILVVVDEAYYEFSGCTVVPLTQKYDNLVVLRTFSKWAGLAGLRVGYGVLPQQLMPYLLKIKQPYNINAAAMVAAIESLADVDYLLETVKAIVHERARLFRKLEQFEFMELSPTQANFILCRIGNSRARHLHMKLQKRGIFLRYFDAPMLEDCLRISVGKPEHTDALVQTIEAILDEDERAKVVEPKF